ncbi:hypothetical protein F4861DRAFT_512293 [Xylaria intraflava]|nr:hypothetical protein F4861DRAFT_512293 [Xylaria intraflava]
MFTCRACLRRSFDALYGCGRPRNPKTSRYNVRPLTRSSRRYATVATYPSSTDATSRSLVPSSAGSYGKKAPAVGRSVEWAARKELEYLKDPFHIANRVSNALKQDNLELAAQITRKASRDTNVTVSWNHLIDYHMQKGRLNTALKFYNEMKKRAQQPNAQTFTIIFRGCAKSQHPKLAVGEAVKLYQSMLSIGRIKPNTIHLNAVLQVCAKVEDLDSMFSILKSSENHLQSPNNLTYTTILNALRAKANKVPAENDGSESLTENELRKEKESAIRHAKAIWDEVISRWTAGSIFIDEELVCAMGRILLMGGYKDIDSIENLLQQTMFIPRQANKEIPQNNETKETSLVVAPRTMAPGAPANPYPTPGNNSLSLILEALQGTRKTSRAGKYWSLFTRKYYVVPDANNWNQYLKAVRQAKNSGRAAMIVQNMPADMIKNQHIRNAMKTCLQDNLNRSALSNATRILEVVGRVPWAPDVRTLRAYLQVGHAFKRSFDIEAKRDYAAAMASWAGQMAGALEKLFGAYQSLVKKSNLYSDNSEDLGRIEAEKAEILALERKMCAAYDILISQHADILGHTQLSKMKLRHAGLTRLINTHLDEKWGRRKPRDEGASETSEMAPAMNPSADWYVEDENVLYEDSHR